MEYRQYSVFIKVFCHNIPVMWTMILITPRVLIVSNDKSHEQAELTRLERIVSWVHNNIADHPDTTIKQGAHLQRKESDFF